MRMIWILRHDSTSSDSDLVADLPNPKQQMPRSIMIIFLLHATVRIWIIYSLTFLCRAADPKIHKEAYHDHVCSCS